MSPAARRTAAVLVAVAATLATAALSAVRYTPPGADVATVRLSWRTVSEQVRECRRLSDAELAELPVHMRRPEACEGRVLPYDLRVELDGREVVRERVHAAGARGDRPLFVFREIAVPPGTHHVAVRFVREGAPDDDDDDDEAEDDAVRPPAPARLVLDGTLRLGPGDVALVTYDADRRALVARTPGPRRGR